MIYHIYANRSNIGDWLSAMGIQKLISPLEITECLCDVPFIDETMQRLSGASERDLIVIGGGGLLMDYFTPFWKAFEPVAHRVPFCIWGIGYCDLKNEASLAPNELIENIINRSKLCIVRDELSRSYLSHCNLPEPVQCPSINVIDRLSIAGKDLLHVDNFTTAGEDTYNAMCLAAERFADIKKITGRQTNNRITRNSEKELQQILSLYKQSAYVLSSALHGCIIAVAMGLKVLAVSGDRKIEGFMEAIGLQDWVLDVKDVNLVSNRLMELHHQPYKSIILDNIRKKNIAIGIRIKQLAANL